MIKDGRSKVVVDERYIDVCSENGEFLIGFVNIKELYINKEIDLNISDLFRLAKYVKVFLIDGNGNLIGRFKRFKF
ncbi:MAG: hypothetical protein HXX81_07465 [Campylobacterales bacterium]|nr:hypothetical protein [Campylobacterales bacterium]